MPSKPTVPVDDIVKALCKVGIFKDSAGNLKPRCDAVWQQASKLLDNRMSGVTLNFHARINRNKIRTKVGECLGIATILSSSIQSTDSSINSIDDDNFEPLLLGTERTSSPPLLCVNIEVDETQWSAIAPVGISYKSKNQTRNYEVLQPSWTDVIARLTYEKTKVPCSFVFKRAALSNTEESVWLKIFGRCNECGANFKGHCLSRPKPGSGITIAIVIPDTRGKPHEGKRPLKGVTRIQVGEELLSKKSVVWKQQASKSFDFGDSEPPHIPKLEILRKVRQEAINRDLRVKSGLNAIESIQQLKYTGEFGGYIREIGLDEFYCIYCSPLQIKIYQHCVKTVKRVAIDATGRVVSSIKKPNGDLKYVFLYQIVIQGEDGTIPVFQMLSAKHNTPMINYWLNNFVSIATHVPEEAVCDFSLALLNAISISFNECCLKSYIQDCFAILMGEQIKRKPRCFVRLDIAHFIKMFTRNKAFTGKAWRVKDFYVRCVGLLTMCSDLETFKELLHSTIVVGLSECDGQDEYGINLPSQNRLNYLFEQIKCFHHNVSDEDEASEEKEKDYEEPEDVNDEILYFLNDIRKSAEEEAEKTSQYSRPNPYFNREIIAYLCKIARFFPLWTSIMKNIFQSNYDVATSAIVEAYFKDLKKYHINQFDGPIRADKFFIIHMRSIEAACKFEKASSYKKKSDVIVNNDVKKARLDNSKCYINSVKDEESLHEGYKVEEKNHLHEEENWMGKITSSKASPIRSPLKEVQNTTNQNIDAVMIISESKENPPKKQMQLKNRGKYLSSCPDVSLIHNRPLRRNKNYLLKNGILLGPVQIGRRLVQIKNTCHFDSIASILSIAYADNCFYKNEINHISEQNLTLAFVKNFAENGPSGNLYYERGILLSSIFNEETNVLNCACNASWLVKKLLDNVFSYDIENCATCAISGNSIIELNQKIRKDFTDELSNFLSDFFSDINTCKHNKQIHKKAGIHLIIDTELTFDKNVEKITNEECVTKVTLQQIPIKIQQNNMNFILSGLVQYISNAKNDIGHYIAYCRRVNGRWEIHNDISKEIDKKCNADKREVEPSLLIYTRIE